VKVKVQLVLFLNVTSSSSITDDAFEKKIEEIAFCFRITHTPGQVHRAQGEQIRMLKRIMGSKWVSVMMRWGTIVQLMSMDLSENWVADSVVDINSLKQCRLVVKVLASHSAG